MVSLAVPFHCFHFEKVGYLKDEIICRSSPLPKAKKKVIARKWILYQICFKVVIIIYEFHNELVKKHHEEKNILNFIKCLL